MKEYAWALQFLKYDTSSGLRRLSVPRTRQEIKRLPFNLYGLGFEQHGFGEGDLKIDALDAGDDDLCADQYRP